MQFSESVRNARADSVETVLGTSPVMRIRSGAPPANTAASRTGTVLATIALPSDWMGDAASGVKSLAGTWQDASADASGTAGHWEILDNGETTVHMQGTCTGSGGGGDMEIDNPALVAGQQFTVTAFSWTEGNA